MKRFKHDTIVICMCCAVRICICSVFVRVVSMPVCLVMVRDFEVIKEWADDGLLGCVSSCPGK